MLMRLKTLSELRIKAADGEVGKVKTFYFDDQTWALRYLVVDTGGWLSEDLVLLHPTCLAKPNRKTKLLPVTITKKQIEESPNLMHNEPVSKQKLAELHAYYDWPLFWAGGLMAYANTPVSKRLENGETPVEEGGDPHLRSATEIKHYTIQATDGELGTLYDFVIGTRNWNVRYLIVDTGSWLPGKKVLISPHWIKKMVWEDAVVFTTLDRQGVENSPEYDPRVDLSPDYERKLYHHYGRSMMAEREKAHHFVS